jgi:hypothetical protein
MQRERERKREGRGGGVRRCDRGIEDTHRRESGPRRCSSARCVSVFATKIYKLDSFDTSESRETCRPAQRETERQRECVLVRDRGQEREKEGEALSERPHLTFEQFVQRIWISSSSERRSSRWCGSLCCEGVVVWLTVPGRHAREAIEESRRREGGKEGSVSLTTTRAC